MISTKRNTDIAVAELIAVILQYTHIKNTPNVVYFMMRSRATGDVLEGVTPTGYVCKDYGPQEFVQGQITEVGRGVYKLNGTAEDFNGNSIGFLFTYSGAVDYDVVVRPMPVSIAGATNKADIATSSAVVQYQHDRNILGRTVPAVAEEDESGLTHDSDVIQRI